jgi:hypothetical protein
VDVSEPASQSSANFDSGLRRRTASACPWDMEVGQLVTTMVALDGSNLSSVRAEDVRKCGQRPVAPRLPSSSKSGHSARVGLLPPLGITL